MFPQNRFLYICIAHCIVIKLILLALFYLFPDSSKRCYIVAGECVLFIVFSSWSFSWVKGKFLNDKVKPGDKAVFITGCDSGFGFYLAKHLEFKGYHVFASALNPFAPDMLRLKSECSERLHVFELDVTKEESVQKALEFVTSKLLSLNFWAVVNNAGILTNKRCDFSTIQDYQQSLEVNCIGMIRVTKAFLPLIKKSKGRIINVTSFAGRLAYAAMSPYVTSKFAAVGFSDSLRHELNVWKVPVITIEPDFFRTKLLIEEHIDRLSDKMVGSLDADILEDYGKEYFEASKQYIKSIVQNASTDINLVIECIDSAISSVYPHVVYRPCGKFWNKIFIHVYEILPPSYQNALMKILMSGGTKPKRVIERYV